MALGPDLDWLADDEGNLRPDAARIVGQARPPEAAPIRPGPPRTAPRAAPLDLPFQIPRIPRAWLPVGLAGAVLIGIALGRWHAPRPAQQEVVSSDHPASERDLGAAAPGNMAVVNAINVNLRVAPGLYAPVLWKLRPGEVIRVRGEREGWFSVESTSGLQGYVFGAFLRGVTSGEGRPAAVTNYLRGEIEDAEVSLRPGDRVLAREDGNGSTLVLLPSGHHLRVPSNALVILD